MSILHLFRRLALSTGLALAALPASADVDPTVREMHSFLSSVSTLQARFRQVRSDGTFRVGTIYLKRPGRARIDFDGDAARIIAASGSVITVNADGGVTSRRRLRDVPLSLLLIPGVDLLRSGALHDVSHGQDLVRATLVDPRHPGAGSVAILFRHLDGHLFLHGWETRSQSGSRTYTELEDIRYNVPLSASLFRLP